MTKLIRSFCVILCITTLLCSCGKQEEPLPEIEEKDTDYIYSQDVKSLFENNAMVVNPFPEDKLLDRYNNTIYYYNPIIGLYSTDLIGSSKNIVKSFESNINVIFSTQNRINSITKTGKYFKNVYTRKNSDEIKILFITNDWIYYKTTSPGNQVSYFRINLSGTCEELDHDPTYDDSIPDKIMEDYYFPQIVDYTVQRTNTVRSRNNNFSITFPDTWKYNYTIHDEKGLFIVYYKPRIDKNIQYEFFRIVKDDSYVANNITPIENTNDTLLLPNGKYKIGKYVSNFTFSDNPFDLRLIEKMNKDISSIIYSIKEN